MSQPDQTQVVALEVARRTVDDIKHLRDNEAFRRYFQYRLHQRADYFEDQLKHGVMSHEEREVTRKLWLEYEELTQMMDKDFAACVKAVTDAQQGFILGTRGNG